MLSPVFAHPLSGDGTVSGDLQFENQDIPVSGRPLLAYLKFVAINNIVLDLQHCFCRLLAYQGQASPSAKPDAQMSFTPNATKTRIEGNLLFPKPGPYMIVVLGRPLPGKSLPPFILSTVIEVMPK
jgi:hypothetical protein